MKDQMIKFYGTTWCPDCIRAKIVLDKVGAEYEYINIDLDESAANFVEKVNEGYRSVPTLIFPNGIKLVEPNRDDILNVLEIEE